MAKFSKGNTVNALLTRKCDDEMIALSNGKVLSNPKLSRISKELVYKVRFGDFVWFLPERFLSSAE